MHNDSLMALTMYLSIEIFLHITTGVGLTDRLYVYYRIIKIIFAFYMVSLFRTMHNYFADILDEETSD